MAETIQVDGVATITVGTGTAGALETLGKSIDGVQITEFNATYDVYGDEGGGPEGVPIDCQDMGEWHVIRMLLTKYDEAVINKLRAIFRGGTAGAARTKGGLFGAGSGAFRVVLHSVLRPRNYPTCIFKEPREVNKGTKHSQAQVIFTAYDWSGVLYDSTTA